VMAVLAFAKIDTLAALTESLLRCDLVSELHLVLHQDSPDGSRFAHSHGKAARRVEKFLERFAKRHASDFASITLGRNKRNLGPCRSSVRVIDRAFDRGDFVIFAEDDCVFTQDALRWFAYARDELIGRDEVAAIAAESMYYRAAGRSLSPGEHAALRIETDRRGLAGAYYHRNWVPSNCFAVDRAGWQEFGQIRDHAHGDVLLGHYFRDNGLACAEPVVPRMADIGMTHPLGYSVAHHGVDNLALKRSIVLLTADDLALEARRFEVLEPGHARFLTTQAVDPGNGVQSGATATATRTARQRPRTHTPLMVLGNLHRILRPGLCLEIGVRAGDVLQLAARRAVGIDPEPQVDEAWLAERPHIRLARMTSDEFFARPDLDEIFGGDRVDLTVIDQRRGFRQALRDFINAERLAAPAGTIVVNGVVPTVHLAGERKPSSGDRAGDVWQIVDCLTRYRPDLDLRLYAQVDGGLLVATNLDPASTILAEEFDAILAGAPASAMATKTALLGYLARVPELAAPLPPDLAN
jgi:hypothetical protein